MKCVICGIETDGIKEAIDRAWKPYFYEAEIERGPACPECSEILLHMSDDGEMDLKEQFRGKIVYKEKFGHTDPEERIIVDIFLQNSAQSILN